MSNGTSPNLNSEQNLASIPMAQGGLTRLAISHLRSAGVPLGPVLERSGLTPELIAEPEERLSVRSQIALLDEAAIALKDDCIGFTLARDFDLREIGLLYYVMACSQTLGDALKRIARYSKITNEALVFGYREGNRLIISLSYSGVPRHSDRHQLNFACLLHYEFAACSQGRTSYRNTSRSLIIDREAPPKWCDLSERKWSSVLTQTSLPSTLTHVPCHLFTLILISMTFS
jgi:Arabinose-binding domain of AraC transcription regulator, N-term